MCTLIFNIEKARIKADYGQYNNNDLSLAERM